MFNGHMMMLDKSNEANAEVMVNWLDRTMLGSGL
jgi:hypothetical protein